MERKLITKTQKILPKTPQYASSFSSTITSAPEDEEVIKRKGTVFGVFEVSGPIEFETSVIAKTISDILQDSYYQSDNISPVQSLERAILNTKEKLTKLNENSLRGKETNLELNIVVTALWGNVLYIVQHGRGKATIMREGDIRPVSFLVEGNFSSASGIVKNEDVVIISTTSFGEKYPPEALLRTGNNDFEGLPPESSCLMIKFSVSNEFTSEEQIDFGFKKKKVVPIDLKKLKNKIASKNEEKEKQRGIISIRENNSSISPDKLRKMIIAILLVGFTLSVFLTAKGFLNKKESEPAPVEIPPPQEATVSTTEDKSFFYDLSITESNIIPISIASSDTKVYVADSSSGKLYISSIETPQFKPLEGQFPGIKNLVYKDGFIYFRDDTGYKEFDPQTETVEVYLNTDNLGLTFPYLEYVYEITGDTIKKHSLEEEQVWAQSTNLSNTVAMVIDENIFTLSEDGNILKFTSGIQDTFELSNMDRSMTKPTSLVLSPNSSGFYVVDKVDQSIVNIDMDGNFIKRLYHNKPGAWNDIRSIAITPSGEKLFVLSGTSVYEMAL